MRRRISVIVAAALLVVIALLSHGVSAADDVIKHVVPPYDTDPALEKMQKAAEKQRNEKRQGDLKRDTDELYKLASDLKKSVDSSNEHVLSLEVLRKTEAIQKLAKSVHDKMKADGYASTIPE